MHLKTFELGSYETNCYIVSDEKSLECAVIDPGADASTIEDYLEENKLRCSCVLLTHSHFDHTGAVYDLMEETGAPLYMNKKDDGLSIDGGFYKFTAPEGTNFFKEGDVVIVGTLSFTVIETPGHTPGGVTLLCVDSAAPEEKLLFTGDTLFRDSCGRTDFPGSSADELLVSLRKLYELPGDYDVYPGHMSATSLDRERRYNYFMHSAVGNG